MPMCRGCSPGYTLQYFGQIRAGVTHAVMPALVKGSPAAAVAAAAATSSKAATSKAPLPKASTMRFMTAGYGHAAQAAIRM